VAFVLSAYGELAEHRDITLVTLVEWYVLFFFIDRSVPKFIAKCLFIFLNMQSYGEHKFNKKHILLAGYLCHR
jgi:hypothetical protein